MHPSRILVGEPWPEISRLQIEEEHSSPPVLTLVAIPLVVTSLLLVAFAIYGMMNADPTIVGTILTLAGTVFTSSVGVLVGHATVRYWR